MVTNTLKIMGATMLLSATSNGVEVKCEAGRIRSVLLQKPGDLQ